MKSQVALDYFIVVSFFILILTPYIIYLTKLSASYKEDKDLALAMNALQKIGQMIDWIGFQGEPAKVSLIITIPESVISMNYTQNMIIWKVKTSAGISDISYDTKFNVTLNITKRGELKVIIEAFENNVKVYVS
ncbi:MAG: hypothetical protein QW641_01465 [Candidatus Aenigmatarchaeota archaeon]